MDKQITTNDVLHFLQRWQQLFNSGLLEELVACYDQTDGALWGTFSTELRTNPEQIREYFANVFSKKAPHIALHSPTIRIRGSSAVATGTFTFSSLQADQQHSVTGRYSFTLCHGNNEWRILDHHSSVMPVLPPQPVE